MIRMNMAGRVMKTTRIILASALAGALLACNPLTIEIKPAKGAFTAQSDGYSTKTSLSGASILWSSGDAIKVFDGTGSEEYTLESGAGEASAVFTGDEIEAETYYAVYPYSADASLSAGVITATVPATQYGVVNSFDNDINLAVACSNNHTLQFKNVCGYLRFQIIESDITEIIIKSNGGEALAGDVDITFDGDGLPVVGSVANPSSTVTILPKSPATHFAPGVYIAAVLPRSYASGIEMSFTRLHAKEDALQVWPLKAKKTGSSSLTVSRSVVKSLGIVDKRLAWECLGKDDTGVPVGYHKQQTSHGHFIDYYNGRTFYAIGAYRYCSYLDACFGYKDGTGYGVFSPVTDLAKNTWYKGYNMQTILQKEGTYVYDEETDPITTWSTQNTTYFRKIGSYTDAAFNGLSSYSAIKSVYDTQANTNYQQIWTDTTGAIDGSGSAYYYAFKLDGKDAYGIFRVTLYQAGNIMKFIYKIASGNTGTPEAIPE